MDIIIESNYGIWDFVSQNQFTKNICGCWRKQILGFQKPDKMTYEYDILYM